MVNSWANQLDYLFLFSGVAHLFLAAICETLNCRVNRYPPLKWLSLFGLLHAAGDWLKSLALNASDSVMLSAMSFAILSFSYICLIEFARALIPPRNERRSATWVLIPFSCVIALPIFAGAKSSSLSSASIIGVAAGLCASFAMLRSRKIQAPGIPLLMSGIGMAVYALPTAMGLLRDCDGTASFLNSNLVQLWPPGLTEVIQGSLAILMSVSVWKVINDDDLVDTARKRSKAGWRYAGKMSLALLAVLTGGWILTQIVTGYTDNDIRYHLDTRTETIADCIDRDLLKKLTGTIVDTQTGPYRTLKKQFSELRRLNPDCRFIYLMAPRDGRIVFLLDSEPEKSKDYSPPGQVYWQPSASLIDIFRSGQPFVEGPVEDPWGVWLSGHAAVRDPGTNRIIAAVGMDIDAGDWYRKIRLHRLAPIIITMLTALLFAGFQVNRQKSLNDSSRIAASEARYRALFNSGDDAVFVYRLAQDGTPGKFIEVNDMACQRLGYPRERLLRLSLVDIDEAGRPEELRMVSLKLAVKRRVLFERVHLTEGGQKIWVEINARLFDLHGEPAVLSVARDVTERKTLENQLIQSQKLESLGQLAAGVAHEINNPVAFINSNFNTLDEYRRDLTNIFQEYYRLEELLEYGGDLEEVVLVLRNIRRFKEKIHLDVLLSDFEKIMAESRDGTDRIKSIVRSLKDFSRTDTAERRYADISKGIESTLNIVWNEIKYKATIIKEYNDIPEIYCYPQQLNQVFMNILVNAAQSIIGQGEISIWTGYRDQSKAEIEVRITDTGKGISPEHLSRIFEPFFTTKPMGEGTGLGLSITQKIIARHKGTMTVQSEIGKGTTFIITLPVSGPGEDLFSDHKVNC